MIELTTKQVAILLDRSRSSVARYIWEDHLHPIKKTGEYIFDRDEVMKFRKELNGRRYANQVIHRKPEQKQKVKQKKRRKQISPTRW